MDRKTLIALLGATALAACTNAQGGKGGGGGSSLLSYEEATACINEATDPDSPVMGGFDVKRLTNTCDVELNVAYCVSDGQQPVCPTVEQPALSPNEWTRAFVTQNSGGIVSYGACQPPERVQTDEDSWYCEEIN